MKRITFPVDPELHQKVKLKTTEQDTSIREVGVKLFERWLKQKRKRKCSSRTAA